MPIIYNKVVYDDCQLGIWEIEESYEEMYSKIHFFDGEIEKLKNYKSTVRQTEWLSVRRLLREMRGEPTQIIYNEQRKPFLFNSNSNISISHSRTMTGILLSKNLKLGLDLEYMTPNIEKVAHKFINNDEYLVNETEQRNFHLYIHWCAKEALYKLCDKQDINFKKNITIEPFEPDECGEIMGWVDNKFWHDKFLLRYFKLKNYAVVYCTK
ncbi:MAG: 4-phosphopantetheinyl transferase family protein [Bacteroidales bacterium]|nr:4-phosphopantetheinyl transferase family protein [Bacteroidales bacterium]MBN2819332.1 4-phosphopantetheinyl transferase family protein [Bacteroidales bacterium]